MNTISQIDLRIKSEPEKTVDFFISLYKFKKKHGKIPPTFFPLMDGIELDKVTTTILKPSEEDIQEANTRIKAFYNFLSEQVGNPDQLFGDTYKEFKEDAFTKVLQEEIILFEVCKRAFGSGELNLFNTCMSLTAEVLDNIGMDAIGETFARQMLVIYLKTITQNENHFFEIEPPRVDAFQVNSIYFDQSYYYEKEGMLIPFDEKTSPDYFSDYYLQKGEDVLRCKTNEDEEVMEITIYQQATIQNQKLLTSPQTITETLYIPSEESGSFFASLYGETTEAEDEPDFSEPDIKEENPIPVAAYIDAFHRYGSFMNKAPNNKKENQELADRCIFHFYRMLQSNYSELTEDNLMVVTGYICSLLGVLDNNKNHSYRQQTAFREYLYLSVQDAFKRHS